MRFVRLTENLLRDGFINRGLIVLVSPVQYENDSMDCACEF